MWFLSLFVPRQPWVEGEFGCCEVLAHVVRGDESSPAQATRVLCPSVSHENLPEAPVTHVRGPRPGGLGAWHH